MHLPRINHSASLWTEKGAVIAALEATIRAIVEAGLGPNQSVLGIAMVSVGCTPLDQLRRSRTLLLRDALCHVAHRKLGSRDGEVPYAVVIAETTAVVATRGPDGTLVGESVNGWETNLAGTTSSGASGAVDQRSIAAGVSSLVDGP